MSKRLRNFFQEHKRFLLSHLLSLGVLLTGFVICRYAVFGVIHGMKEWPVDLLIAGLVVQLISLLARKQYASWFSAIGYFLGFWLGAIFHKEGVDPGGGRTDNLWQIWTIVFLICILAGILFEVILKWRKLLKDRT